MMSLFNIPIVEWVGYAAMAVLLLSFLMKDIKKLRIINTLGCLLFVLYGFLLTPYAFPIIATNLAIVVINVYYLVRSTKQ